MRYNQVLAWALTSAFFTAPHARAEDATSSTALPAEFLLYLVEFEDGENGWVDPETLQLISNDSKPETPANHAAASNTPGEEKNQ